MVSWFRRKKSQIVKSDIGTMLDQAGLDEFRERIQTLMQDSARISVGERFNGAAIGQSRFGGMPDLPGNAQWPTCGGRALSFLAQINLADASTFRCSSALPQHGLLSFFYDCEKSPWGFNPNDRDGWRLQFLDDANEALSRTDYPQALPKELRFDSWSMTFRDEMTIPSLGSSEIDELDFDDTQIDAYGEVWEAFCGGEPQHRLLGHAEPIQGDMQLECQLVSHGINCGSPEGYRDPRANELEAGARDWRLLFQIDSDDQLDFNWGDGGRLYFWIPETALSKCAFDRSWLVLQCY